LEGDFAFEVAADCVQRQAEPLAGFLALGTVVIMPTAFWVGPVGLEGVGATIDEETEVIRPYAGRRFKAKHWHSLLTEKRSMTPLLHVGGKMMRVIREIQQFGNGFVTFCVYPFPFIR
jgi:hypothetical protein